MGQAASAVAADPGTPVDAAPVSLHAGLLAKLRDHLVEGHVAEGMRTPERALAP